MGRSVAIFCMIVGLAWRLSVPAAAWAEADSRAADGRIVDLYQGSYALVIGQSDYAHLPDLPGVRRDIEAVSRVLEKHGFSVTTARNLDRVGLDKAFSDFINRYGLDPGNRLLFYFAGHGHTVTRSYGGEMGYIVPVDAPNPNRDRTGFMIKAMDMQQIEVYARRIESKHALFLFDSCFSGSIFALSRAAPRAIDYKTGQPVRQFITSGSANETVPDASVFRTQFTSGIDGEADLNEDGYVTGAELGEFLQTSVINYSRGSQHPQYGKIRDPRLDKGDYVFIAPQRPGPTKTAALAPAAPGFKMDDLKQQADKTSAARRSWKGWQERMKGDYDRVVAFERGQAQPGLKAAAYKRFLEAYGQDNPYSKLDQALRATAQKRLDHWTKLAQAPRPVAKPAVPTTAAQAARIKPTAPQPTQPAKKDDFDAFFNDKEGGGGGGGGGGM